MMPKPGCDAKKRYGCAIVFAGISTHAWGQIPVTGRIISGDGGEGLPGVNVVVKGTTDGTITDTDGRYSISVPSRESSLIFSYIGHVTQEAVVGERSAIDISMELDVTTLSEVVVVGYGTQEKVNITGAVSAVKIDDKITSRALSNVSTGLSGLVPGLAVAQSTGMAACYISIENMTIYDAAGAAANPDKIDLVYLYRVIAGKTFAHALVSPAADPQYLPGVTLPAGVNKSTRVSKAWALRDQHLARLQFGVFIDDVDFEKIDLSTAPNFAINMRAESGAWVETADGRYRAYIYVNSVNNGGPSMTISMKRLQVN